MLKSSLNLTLFWCDLTWIPSVHLGKDGNIGLTDSIVCHFNGLPLDIKRVARTKRSYQETVTPNFVAFGLVYLNMAQVAKQVD